MASFQAKIGWKRQRKIENKNCSSVSFLLDALQKILKKQQKNSKKLKNTIRASFQAKVGWKRLRKRENKINVLFRSCLTRNRKFQKNSKKFKKLKNTIMESFQAEIDWGMQRKRENKNCRSIPYLPDA